MPGRYLNSQVQPTIVAGAIAYPFITASGVTYPDDYVELIPGAAEPDWINNYNQKAGQRYDAGVRKAKVWLADNTEIDLGVTPEDMDSLGVGINDAGMVLVRTFTDAGVHSGLVRPVDQDADGTADTWYLDLNEDGINDLLLPLDYEGYAPLKINASGQVLFDWCLLTPDYTDADGDGNPWYADADGDGSNDLLVFFTALPDFAETYTEAFDINDAGVVVGTSNDRAVRWDDPASPVDLGQPNKHCHSMEAWTINNNGLIMGHCLVKQRDSLSLLFHEGSIYDLNAMIPGETHVHAQDLNDNGWFISLGGFVYIPVSYP